MEVKVDVLMLKARAGACMVAPALGRFAPVIMLGKARLGKKATAGAAAVPHSAAQKRK